MIRYMLIVVLSCGNFWNSLCLGENATDSMAAAITVYKNPDFFKNMTTNEKGEAEEKKQGDAEEYDEEEIENIFDDEKENFYDFDDIYRYSGESKKPNPPAAPDFPNFFDESLEFQPNPQDVGSSESISKKKEGKNYYGLLPSVLKDDEEHIQRESEENFNEQKSYEIEEISPEKVISSNEKKYHVALDEDLYPTVKPELYERSKQYYNPVFKKKMISFSYPLTEELDYYPVSKKYENNKTLKHKVYTDRKKGTREYYKDHELEEVVDIPNTSNIKAGSKHVFKTVSKIGIKGLKPVLLKPYSTPKFKTKIKLAYWPVKRIKVRIGRQVPNDSVYELNSDYDSDYEFLSSP